MHSEVFFFFKPVNFEPKGIPFGSKSKGKLSPQSYPIQFERKWKYSFVSVPTCEVRKAFGGPTCCITHCRAKYWPLPFLKSFFFKRLQCHIIVNIKVKVALQLRTPIQHFRKDGHCFDIFFITFSKSLYIIFFFIFMLINLLQVSEETFFFKYIYKFI